ncbi:MAG: histidine phosphatase family protein, partial [Pseudanabaena sp.]
AIPAQGKNNIIVGHDDIFEAATGIYPEPQGVAFVLTPNGRGGFELVAKVLPDEWNQLLP